MPVKKSFELLVLGAGSGGMASARRAASYGARVGIIEHGPLGGTCVNVGCVPKKVMFNTSSMAESFPLAQSYGFRVPESPEFNFGFLKSKRDAYIARLNGIYERNLEKEGVELIRGHAVFSGPNSVQVGDDEYSADRIVIAVGGRPAPVTIPGGEHAINSDDFFTISELPKRVAVVGAGYIAVELAGVYAGLGVDTHLFIRHEHALRKFDIMIQEKLMGHLRHSGVKIHTCVTVDQLTKESDGTTSLLLSNGETIGAFDHALYAIGRIPLTEGLGLENAGVVMDSRGFIPSDKFEKTNVDHIFALGDVNGKMELTPVAIAAGRKLADRLYGGKIDSYLEYDNVPTVVFTHPPIATTGMTEAAARAFAEKEGMELKIYSSNFINMYFTTLEPEKKPQTSMKMICVGADEKVVGIHLVGHQVDEIMQGFGVAVKMGATKAQIDSCVAIHPTAAEELVTLR